MVDVVCARKAGSKGKARKPRRRPRARRHIPFGSTKRSDKESANATRKRCMRASHPDCQSCPVMRHQAGRAEGIHEEPCATDDARNYIPPVRVTLGAGTKSVKAFCHGAGTSEKMRSEEHTSELQSRENLVCRL